MSLWSKIKTRLRRPAAAAAAAPATPVFGLLSGTPAMLEETEFFRWFNLKLKQKYGDGTIVYSPAADPFRDKIDLILLRTPAGETRWITIHVNRFFMDEREHEAAVRDLIKSFVLAVAGDDAPRLSHVADEIQFAGLKSSIFVRDPGATLPEQPSAIQDIVLDRERGPLTLQLTHLVLWFDNLRRDEARRFIVRAYPIGSPELAEVTATVEGRGMTIRTMVV